MRTHLVALLLVLLVLMTACGVKTVEEVKDPGLVGEKVTVKGEVMISMKLGTLSGYTLKDKTGTIGISASNLPKEGETLKVTGVLMKDTLLGYYIKTD